MIIIKKCMERAPLVVIILGITLVSSYFLLNWLFPSYFLPCPPGKIEGYTCGPTGGSELVCYDPMPDANRTCDTASDCMGSCVANINDCRQVERKENLNYFYIGYKVIAICDSNIRGECSTTNMDDADNNLYKYSEIPQNILLTLKTNYSLMQNDKIIGKKILFCA